MDLITLALAMKNGGGGGGAGAPMIIHGQLAEIEGEVVVQIEEELEDIYAAVSAVKPVSLEWSTGDNRTMLPLVSGEYDDEEEAYEFIFGTALFAANIPCVVSVTFNNSKTGYMELVHMTAVNYDIEIRHNGNDDTWEANEFDLAALTIKPTGISVRAIKIDGYLRNYFVLEVIVLNEVVEVVLLNMDPNVSAAQKVIPLVVFPDGTVMKQ